MAALTTEMIDELLRMFDTKLSDSNYRQVYVRHPLQESKVLHEIVFAGSTSVFVPHLLSKLQSYDRKHTASSTLSDFLESMRAHLGFSDQQRLDEIITHINRSNDLGKGEDESIRQVDHVEAERRRLWNLRQQRKNEITRHVERLLGKPPDPVLVQEFLVTERDAVSQRAIAARQNAIDALEQERTLRNSESEVRTKLDELLEPTWRNIARGWDRGYGVEVRNVRRLHGEAKQKYRMARREARDKVFGYLIERKTVEELERRVNDGADNFIRELSPVPGQVGVTVEFRKLYDKHIIEIRESTIWLLAGPFLRESVYRLVVFAPLAILCQAASFGLTLFLIWIAGVCIRDQKMVEAVYAIIPPAVVVVTSSAIWICIGIVFAKRSAGLAQQKERWKALGLAAVASLLIVCGVVWTERWVTSFVNVGQLEAPSVTLAWGLAASFSLFYRIWSWKFGRWRNWCFRYVYELRYWHPWRNIP